MKYLSVLLLLMTGCGVDVHGHLDTVQVAPIQVQVSTTINYSQAEEFCSAQCSGNSACTTSCYDQFLAVLAASSSLPVPTATPSPTP